MGCGTSKSENVRDASAFKDITEGQKSVAKDTRRSGGGGSGSQKSRTRSWSDKELIKTPASTVSSPKTGNLAIQEGSRTAKPSSVHGEDSDDDEDEVKEGGSSETKGSSMGAGMGFGGLCNESLRNIALGADEEEEEEARLQEEKAQKQEQKRKGRESRGVPTLRTTFFEVPTELKENQQVIDGLVWEEVPGVGFVHGAWMQEMTQVIEDESEGEDEEDEKQYEKMAEEFSTMAGISKESIRSLLDGMKLSVADTLWRRVECEATLNNKWMEGYRRMMMLKTLLHPKSDIITRKLRLSDLEESYLYGATKRVLKYMRKIALRTHEIKFQVEVDDSRRPSAANDEDAKAAVVAAKAKEGDADHLETIPDEAEAREGDTVPSKARSELEKVEGDHQSGSNEERAGEDAAVMVRSGSKMGEHDGAVTRSRGPSRATKPKDRKFSENIIHTGVIERRRNSTPNVEDIAEVVSRASMSMQKEKVVIVGGGLAGLTAGHFLRAKGYEVVILEASDRLGGRMETQTFKLGTGGDGKEDKEVNVQSGCEVFHESSGNPFRILASTFGLGFKVVEGDGTHLECANNILFDSDGAKIADKVRDESLLDMDFMLEELDEMKEAELAAYRDEAEEEDGGAHVRQRRQSSLSSMPSVFPALTSFRASEAIALALKKANWSEMSEETRVMWKWNLERYFVSKFGTVPQDLTMGEVEQGFQAFAGKDAAITTNINKLVDGLAAHVQSHTQTKVKKIEKIEKEGDSQGDSPHAVRVHTTKGVFEADRVIVTVPIPVLQREVIEFSPPLPPEKHDAFAQIGASVHEKIILIFERPFWPENIPSFGYVPDSLRVQHGDIKRGDECILIVNLQQRLGVPGLQLCLFGEQAKQAAARSEEENKKFALDILSTLFPLSGVSTKEGGSSEEKGEGEEGEGGEGGNASSVYPQPVHVHCTNWSRNEHISCSSVYVRGREAAEVFPIVSDPEWDDSLLFAGDGTSQFFWGTLQGAMLSAVREVARISRDPTVIHTLQSSTVDRAALLRVGRLERIYGSIESDLKADVLEVKAMNLPAWTRKMENEADDETRFAKAAEQTSLHKRCGWVLDAIDKNNRNIDGFFTSRDTGLVRPVDIRRSYYSLNHTGRKLLLVGQEYSMKHEQLREHLHTIARQKSTTLSEDSEDEGEEE
uniref:Amine oxidase domain-containing protein n=1 Tax=Palpitomonas bilix TaxID=652834 RepID=A0A7S3D5K8_9EUKA|mmetsp:Transcript_20799/g.53638  ORF Transcript_20799/g.53638 Transcript_20799/m.53638 type:complete len:1166 (+) Transcript_20799:274-3771(+)